MNGAPGSQHVPGSESRATQITPGTESRGTQHDASDIDAMALAERSRSPYTTKEKIGRVLWNSVGQRLFALTFHNWYGVRNALLRAFGAKIGSPVRIRPSVIIEQPWNLAVGDNSSIGDRAIVYCLGKVTIHEHVSVSQGAHLCAGTHDYRTADMPLLRPPIVIERYAWVAADAFVGPNVRVAEGALLGARACAMKDLEPWMIYAGNPAQKVKARARFVGEGKTSPSSSSSSSPHEEKPSDHAKDGRAPHPSSSTSAKPV